MDRFIPQAGGTIWVGAMMLALLAALALAPAGRLPVNQAAGPAEAPCPAADTCTR